MAEIKACVCIMSRLFSKNPAVLCGMVFKVMCRRWDFQLCGGPGIFRDFLKSSVILRDSSA